MNTSPSLQILVGFPEEGASNGRMFLYSLYSQLLLF